MKTVADILLTKPKPYNVIAPDALVIDALHMLKDTNLSYVIVMAGSEFCGIFSERDYSRNVALKGRSSANCLVRDAMTDDMPFAALADSVEKCIYLILDFKTRYLPVVDDGAFEGVITMHDILRIILSNKELVFDNDLAERMLESEGKIY
ncbi:MAG: CBS domain-containing protein [Bacteroidetes bacterium]|nr:MAG: CBS domain-containing protein [Bacteroidota bacterium]